MMKEFLDLSIKNKLVLIIVTTSVIIISIGFFITILYDNLMYKEELIKNSQINASLISEYCIVPLTFEDTIVVNSFLEKFKTIPAITAIYIYNKQDNIFAGSNKLNANDPPVLIPEIEKGFFTEKHYELFQPIIHMENKLGTIYLKTSTEFLKAKIKRQILVNMLLIICLIFLSYLLALRLQSTISTPIINLTRTTEIITKDSNYSIRVRKHGNDEIGLLYDSFNDMINQINIRENERDIAEKLLKQSENEIKIINQELEQRVKQRTSQLEIANKELESFTYTVAHDLRSPLRAIDGFSQILLEEYSDNLNVESSDYLKRVRVAAQHMARLIDDLLNLSHVYLDEMKISNVSLSNIALEVAKNLSKLEPNRKVHFEIEKGISITGDEHLLRIALENLLGNSWKFTSKQKEACIEFGSLKRKKENVFFVRDNGIGFNMKYVNKLFKPFHRLHASGDFHGNGIGLATVQRIIQRHDGIIWAEGELEKGAIIYFTIP